MIDPKYYGLVELVLVTGAVLAFGAWQLLSLRRDARRARLREDARHAERQQGLDERRGEPRE